MDGSAAGRLLHEWLERRPARVGAKAKEKIQRYIASRNSGESDRASKASPNPTSVHTIAMDGKGKVAREADCRRIDHFRGTPMRRCQ
jgi:hypothetical protein